MTTYVETEPSRLSETHKAELEASAIGPEHRDARGYETLYGTDEDKARLRQASIPVWAWRENNAFPGLFIPMYRVSGELIGHQFKPGEPQPHSSGDKLMKYASPVGTKPRLDVPPLVQHRVQNAVESLWITEGVKKADCLASQKLPVIALSGVFNWRSRLGTLGDWEDIPLKGRPIVVCFDSDARHNAQVTRAMRRLGLWLESKGAKSIHYLIVPEEVNGIAVKGVDDYFAAGGTLEGLRDVATTEMPSDNTKDAAFSDAVLADTVASEALDGRYRWAAGLGWMRWDGKVWSECTDAAVTEDIRLWALDGYKRVLDEQRKAPHKDMHAQLDGWRGALAASKLSNLLKLSRGILESAATDFDYDPDVINAQNGIVDLRSGIITPHDPDRLMTKITGCDYVPGAWSQDWDTALEAVPEDVRSWFQTRMGQSITGHTPPDDIILLLQGGGSNGKSTVMDGVSKAAGTSGGYHTAVADRALLGNGNDNHPTEMMDFLGARLAVLEETPEAKHLDVNRVKKLAGTEQITARKMRQDSVTFKTTHTLIINTNYKPLVEETDHGTWRRLAMLVFPYAYRKPGEPITGPNDRVGDQTLRQRVRTDERVAEAVLAWLVKGAGNWYAAGQIMDAPPQRVEDDTLEWRKESDLILSFMDDVLEFDHDRHIYSVELREAFNAYIAGKGHREWTERTFKARFGSHDRAAKNAVEYKRVKKTKDRQAQRSTLTPLTEPPNPYYAWLGVKFQEPDENPQVEDEVEESVPSVPSTPVNREIASYKGGTDEEGTEGTAFVFAPGVDPFADDPFAEAEGDQPPPSAAVPAPAAPHASESVPRAGGKIGFDIESHSAKRLFTHVDLGNDPYARLSGYVTEDGKEVVVNSAEELVKRLEDADEISGHNIIGFDLMALARHHGADYDKLCAKAVDTLRWEQTVNPPGAAHERPWAMKGYYGLDALAERLGMPGKTDDLKALALKHAPTEINGRKLNEKERLEAGFGRIPADDPEYRRYFSGDLKATRGVRRALGEPSSYMQREMKVAHLQHRPTLTGWKVDVDKLDELVRQEADQRGASLQWLHDNCGVPLTRSVSRGRGKNKTAYDEAIKSPVSTNEGRDAIIKALADRGVPFYPKTASGQVALNKDALGEGSYMAPGRDGRPEQRPAMLNPNVLSLFAERGADVDALREMCGHIVTVTSSVQKYQEIMDHLVGDRVHPEVGDLQASGRWAYVRPSVTNIGKRGGKVHQRRPLIADEGTVLICFDADQVDMRGIAGHAQDPAYMELFAPGADAHSMVTDAVFGRANCSCPPDRHVCEWRDYSKRIGHGWNYGMGVKGIANSGVDMALAQQFDDQMNSQFPVLCAWRNEVRERAKAGQLLDNGFGRLMRPNKDRYWTQGPALMGQGAARDILCEGMVRLAAREPEAAKWLRCVVHDEIVLCVPEDRVEEAKALVQEAFAFDFKGVPITVGASKAAWSWDACYAKD